MSLEDNILLKLAKIADEYSNSTGNKVLLVAMETTADGEPMGMTLQKNSSPIITIGVIDALIELLEDEKARALEYLHKAGEKHVAHSASDIDKKIKNAPTSINSTDDAISAIELIMEFKNLKAKGDAIKDTDPAQLIGIMKRMEEIANILKNLESGIKNKDDDNDSSDPLDKFKDTF